MIGSRRTFLTGAGGVLLLGACQPAAVAPSAAPSREIPPGAWQPPEGALELPGFALWSEAGDAPAPLDAPLLTLDGPTTLGALVAGRPALLSFWAPWCAPCIAEKPSLDFLAGRLAAAGAGLAVLSIMVMTTEEPQTAETAAAHQRRFGLTNLAPIADASAEDSPFRSYIGGSGVSVLGMSVDAVSIPRSTLIDPNGRELGRLVNATRIESPPGFVPTPGQKLGPEDVADWPKRELWRDDAMFAFLSKLGGV